MKSRYKYKRESEIISLLRMKCRTVSEGRENHTHLATATFQYGKDK